MQTLQDKHMKYANSSWVFMTEMLKLQVWYATHLMKREPQLSLSYIIDKRLCLQKLFIENKTEWSHIRHDFIQFLNNYPKYARNEIENCVLHHCKQKMRRKWRKHMLDAITRSLVNTGNYNGFTYTKKGWYVVLHFKSSAICESTEIILDRIAAAFLSMLRAIQMESPGAIIIGESWMNNFSPILKLFPEDWKLSAKPTLPDNTNAWWGQFRNCTGGYNYKLGDRFRKSGEFPFPSTKCSCSIEAIIQHLKTF